MAPFILQVSRLNLGFPVDALRGPYEGAGGAPSSRACMFVAVVFPWGWMHCQFTVGSVPSAYEGFVAGPMVSLPW